MTDVDSFPISEHFTAAERHAQERVQREDLGARAAQPILEAARAEDLREFGKAVDEISLRVYRQVRNGGWDPKLQACIGPLIAHGIRDASTLDGYRVARASGPVRNTDEGATDQYFSLVAPGTPAPAGAESIELRKLVVSSAHTLGLAYRSQVEIRAWESRADWLESAMATADRTGSRAEYVAAKNEYEAHRAAKPSDSLFQLHTLGPAPDPKEKAHVTPVLFRPFVNVDARIGVTADQVAHAKRAIASDNQELLDRMRIDWQTVDSPRPGLGHRILGTDAYAHDTDPKSGRWVVPLYQYTQWTPGEKPLEPGEDGLPTGSMSLRELADAASESARLRRSWAFLWVQPASILLKGKGVFRWSTAFGELE